MTEEEEKPRQRPAMPSVLTFFSFNFASKNAHKAIMDAGCKVSLKADKNPSRPGSFGPSPKNSNLLDWNLARVFGDPFLKGLQLRIERFRDRQVTRSDVHVAKIALELEHVAQIVGPRKPK